MTSWRSAFVVVAFLWSLLATVQPTHVAAQAEPESGGPYQNYITWNICQSNCFRDDPQRRTDVQQKFAQLVTESTTLPRAVAAQEMCQAGFTYVSNQLDGALGYDSILLRTFESTERCPSGVGVALFWRGACSTGCRVAEHFDSAIQSPEDTPDEYRGYACGRSNTRDAWYCSFHITSKRTDDRYFQQRQIAHMRLQSSTWRDNGRATVMMGDFNVVPDVGNPPIGMGLWYDTHVESDNCSQNVACKKTHDIQPGDLAAQNRKLDYIFAHDFYCDRQGAEPAVRRYGNLSDHAFVRGYIICPN